MDGLGSPSSPFRFQTRAGFIKSGIRRIPNGTHRSFQLIVGSWEKVKFSWPRDEPAKRFNAGRNSLSAFSRWRLSRPARQFNAGRVRPRILVVEDEPDIRRLNAEVLKSFGYQVDTAEDGMAGWKALRAVRHAPESYALLITDYDMPGLTGLALVKKLRAARLALPVIMATGRLLPEDLFTRYDWLQPVAALIKPYSVEQLLGTVEANSAHGRWSPASRSHRRQTGGQPAACSFDDSSPRSSVQSRFLRLGHLAGLDSSGSA